MTQGTPDSDSVFTGALPTPFDVPRQWLDAYQRSLKLATLGSELASLSMKQWGRQMDYASHLSGAAREHVQNCMSEATQGWTEASKLITQTLTLATNETPAS